MIGLHAKRPTNRVSIPKVDRDSSTVSRPVMGSMQLMDAAGSFPEDEVSLAHHSRPSTTTALTGQPGTASSGMATTVGAGQSGVRISSP